MNEHEVEELLRRTGKALSPDPARLKALFAPLVRPVPSPLSSSFVMRLAASTAVLVFVVAGALWSTTLSTPATDDFAALNTVLEADISDDVQTVALLDEELDALFVEEDVFTDAFLDSVL